jgi:hypothetical protein
VTRSFDAGGRAQGVVQAVHREGWKTCGRVDYLQKRLHQDLDHTLSEALGTYSDLLRGWLQHVTEQLLQGWRPMRRAIERRRSECWERKVYYLKKRTVFAMTYGSYNHRNRIE